MINKIQTSTKSQYLHSTQCNRIIYVLESFDVICTLFTGDFTGQIVALLYSDKEIKTHRKNKTNVISFRDREYIEALYYIHLTT